MSYHIKAAKLTTITLHACIIHFMTQESTSGGKNALWTGDSSFILSVSKSRPLSNRLISVLSGIILVELAALNSTATKLTPSVSIFSLLADWCMINIIAGDFHQRQVLQLCWCYSICRLAFVPHFTQFCCCKNSSTTKISYSNCHHCFYTF